MFFIGGIDTYEVFLIEELANKFLWKTRPKEKFSKHDQVRMHIQNIMR